MDDPYYIKPLKDYLIANPKIGRKLFTMITKDQLHEQVDRTHSYHRPEFQETMDAMGQIRDTCKALGHQLVDTCPISRELSLALTKLDDVNMYAIAALARFEPDDGKSPNVTSHPKKDT